MSKNTVDMKSAGVVKTLELLQEGKISVAECERLIRASTFATTTNASSKSSDDGPQQIVVRDELDIYPWRREERLAEDAFALYDAAFKDRVKLLDDMRKRYIELVKSHSISPFAALLDKYALFAKDDEEFEEGVLILMKMLLEETPSNTIQLHNWKVMKEMPQLHKQRYGHTIKHLSTPLFPPAIAELRLLNEKLLTAVSDAVAKSAESTITANAQSVCQEYYNAKEEQLLGGGYLPVYDAQGSQTGVTDVTPVETEFTKVLKELASLKNEVAKLRSAQATSQWKPRRNNNYNTNNYNRNRNGRSRYNGGGYDEEYDNQQQELPLQSNTQQQIHQEQNNIKINESTVNNAENNNENISALNKFYFRAFPFLHRSATELYEGGDFAQGKTSNIEIDKVLSLCLPAGVYLPCDSLPTITPAKARHYAECVRRGMLRYFPLFLRHHWIASILTLSDDKSRIKITIHDSAPSKLVHDDLRRMFKKIWPALKLEAAPSPRQQRGSDVCGVFMVAHIIADYLNAKIIDAFMLPSRLRPLLVKISKGKMHKADALIKIRDALLYKRYNMVNCLPHKCTNDTYNNSSNYQTEEVQQTPATLLQGGNVNTSTKKERARPAKKLIKQRPHNTTHCRPKPNKKQSELDERIAVLWREVKQREREAANCNLCYMLTASALASVRDGLYHSLTLSELYKRRRLCGYTHGQHDVAETLVALGQPLAALCNDNTNGKETLLPLTQNALNEEIVFVQSNGQIGLPQQLDKCNYTFVLGAAFRGNITNIGAESGHYTLFTQPNLCVVGLYVKDVSSMEYERKERYGNRLNTDQESVKSNSLKVIINEANNDVKRNAVKSALDDSANSLILVECAQNNIANVVDCEKEHALNTAPQLHLNGWGRRPGGHVCPRTWYDYSGKSPHVTQMVWNAITPQTRQQHLRWINGIRAMLDDLLNVSFPTALLELMRRMAVARRWKWSTISKTYANIKAALLNLLMYTNQLQPIKLDEHSEWRAGMATALRYNRETAATTFAPVTLQEVTAAKKKLGYHTEAALYLIMMWAFAARSGDIMNLAMRDIILCAVNTDGTVPVPLTTRRGKGARFRGPYELGSLMTRQDASTLHALMCRKTPHQYLFSDATLVKNAVRYTLRQQNLQFTLPSLRKGTALHMAAMKVPESQIMLMTGHTRLDTLHRYLGYSRQLTTEGVTQRRITQGMSSSSTTRIKMQGNWRYKFRRQWSRTLRTNKANEQLITHHTATPIRLTPSFKRGHVVKHGGGKEFAYK